MTLAPRHPAGPHHPACGSAHWRTTNAYHKLTCHIRQRYYMQALARTTLIFFRKCSNFTSILSQTNAQKVRKKFCLSFIFNYLDRNHRHFAVIGKATGFIKALRTIRKDKIRIS
jgi:hypothetical protein